MRKGTGPGARSERVGKRLTVAYRDARGRFTRKRPASIQVTLPGAKPRTFASIARAAEHIEPLPPTTPKGFGRSTREARALIDRFRGRRLIWRYHKRSATFADLQSARGRVGLMFPKGMIRNHVYVIRVVWRGRARVVAGIWNVPKKGEQPDLWHRVVGAMGDWTDLEKARIFSGESGNTPAAIKVAGVKPGTSFRERLKLLDKRGIPKTPLTVEVYE